MSLPKKGLRRIVIDDHTYEWTIRKRATSGELYHKKKLVAAIQVATDLNRGLLVVDFGVSPPGNWRNPHKTSVTPKTIELAIKKAIIEGWDPWKKGTSNLNYPIEYVPSTDNDSPNAEFDIRSDE